MNMIHQAIMNINVGDLMIPAEKVAHVQISNPLEHALLVLVKSGYSAVPVLDSSYKLKGIIGKSIIINQTLGLERFEFEKLSEMKVQEVMDEDIPTLSKEVSFIEGLKAVINTPFVCVTDQEGYFDGILTRRAILKFVRDDFYSIENK
ncbi:cyclic-di-AMP-binding protein CbpB [Virgibacillus soli]|uniref:Cyclic-di-AMP-binding protein CbpB n=1 Tax=Paracerasibacillus soli TaxID=480284 RepID=A0ABU5CNW2_9BACI|nr:cyclic-di-AMP-binding protein CbpB [Virgibacillus soli]MDY0408048.1 cyclic-di-AMP-binding protein CbpB [Virgibacillus soli]